MKLNKFILNSTCGILIIVFNTNCKIKTSQNLQNNQKTSQESVLKKSLNQQTFPFQNKKVTISNFYSLENDIKYENDLIETTKRKILSQTNPNELRKRLNSDDDRFKIEAIEQLGYIANVDGQKDIENLLLSDASVDVRIACAKALNLIRSPDSKTYLIKALKDNNLRVRIWAGQALALIGAKDESFEFFSEFYNGKNDIPYYSCHIGFLYIGNSKVVPYLLKDTGNLDANIATDAAIKLAQLGYGSDVFTFFKNNLSHHDRYIRMASLTGLAYIGDLPSFQLIKSMVNDNDIFVKDRANTIIEKSNN